MCVALDCWRVGTVRAMGKWRYSIVERDVSLLQEVTSCGGESGVGIRVPCPSSTQHHWGVHREPINHTLMLLLLCVW